MNDNYYQQNKEKRLLYQRQYYQKNKDKIKEYTKKYYESHKDKYKNKNKQDIIQKPLILQMMTREKKDIIINFD